MAPRPETTFHDLPAGCTPGTCPLLLAAQGAPGRLRGRFDAVTGLPNRAYALERIGDLLERADGEPVAVAALALEGFATYNANPDLADALLREIGLRTAALLGDRGVIGRLFGAEFIAAMEVEGDNVAAEVDWLRRRFCAPVAIGGITYPLTASAGAAIHPADGLDAASLMQSACAALTAARQSGGARTALCADKTTQAMERRNLIERELRKAAALDQLSLHYQPKITLKDGGLAGFEALLRWTHPTLGPVSPAEFIPVAEGNGGLIVELGGWVAEEALRFLAEVGRQARPVPVAINVAAAEICAPDYADGLLGLVAESGLPPTLLEVEVTESGVMTDLGAACRSLTALRNAGISTAMDDFGVGFSSLGALRRLPLDVVKLDRSFIMDMPDDGQAIKVVNALVALAHGLNLEVVAEGVEEESQARILHAAACDVGQGWLYGRPLTREAALDRVRRARGAG